MNDIKISYGIYNQRDKIHHHNMYVRVKGASLFYLQRMDEKPYVICKDEIYDILEEASINQYDYCVVISAGCLIKDFNFTKKVRNLIDTTKFGVAGHPLYHPGKWLELHPQFFIVNIQAWVEVGKPNFGTWSHTEQLLPVIERSVENFHHDYTPLWVKPTGKQREQIGAGQGWELMSAMFNNNYSVITLPEEIRFIKFYSYPEHETQQFEDSIKTLTSYDNQNWNQAKLINDTKLVKDQIWLFNSENIKFYNEGKFDIVANTASGFKIFDIFKTPRLNNNAKIIVYDFNPISLAWYKHFYTYHTENLLECIRSFQQRDNFTWIGQTESNYTENYAFNQRLKENFDFFGGEEQFNIYWRQFKNTKVEFVECDLYQRPEEFASMFLGNGNKLVNLSNIFSTDATTIYYGHAEVISRQAKLLASLFVVDPEIQVTIHDFWNRHKIGKVKDIL
jgi:hypothetical protein